MLKSNILLVLFVILCCIKNIKSCTSFYCINSCGSSQSTRGYKLIVANNRDEDIYRPTWPANVWPPRETSKQYKSHLGLNKRSQIVCDQQYLDPPFNLCVYGALDVANERPPYHYSTWLGINERGNVGNLLFFMGSKNSQGFKSRGIIAPMGLQNSSWSDAQEYLDYLAKTRYDFKPFNYIYTDMSNETGAYSIYYLNNNRSEPVSKLNENEVETFLFSLSNSDLERPFRKVSTGKQKFQTIIDEYALNGNKQQMLDAIIFDLLQNKEENYPDPILEAFMNTNDKSAVKGVSQINANYSSYWRNAFSRTSTVILVDYDDNVEYYEYNLTRWNHEFNKIDSKEWQMNNFTFKLRPLYKNGINSSDVLRANFIYFITVALFLYLSIN